MSKEQQQKMSVLLVVSLCLNLFLGGLILGGAVMKHRITDMQPFEEIAPPMRTFLNPRDIARETSDETRDELKGLAFKNLKKLRPELEKVHTARVKLYDLLAAEELDESAVREAIEQLSDAERDAQVASGETIIEMMHLMTPEERARVVERNDRPWHHHKDRDWREHKERKDYWKERREDDGDDD